jgi:hypothetical protein
VVGHEAVDAPDVLLIYPREVGCVVTHAWSECPRWLAQLSITSPFGRKAKTAKAPLSAGVSARVSLVRHH